MPAKRRTNHRYTGFMLAVTLLLMASLYTLIGATGATAAAQADPTPDEPVQAAQVAAISNYLYSELTTAAQPVSFLIMLRDQVDAAQVVASQSLRAANREAKAAALYNTLTAQAALSQAPLRAWLDAQGISYRAFYLVNMIEVEGDLALAQALQQRPEVQRLEANPLVANALTAADIDYHWQMGLHALATAEAEATVAMPYGLDYTDATDVWALGHTGQGIVIASQDTGVEWDNPALRARYRGVTTGTLTSTQRIMYLPLIVNMNSITPTVASTPHSSASKILVGRQDVTETIEHVYNWFDAWGIEGRPSRCAMDAQIPCDDHGHGTHTVGTMVGDATSQGETIIGMAPDAEWIGCRNMRNGFGTPASYTACFEFFLAPYPQGGDPFTDGRPELAPHIINNSWGCPPSEGCDATSLRQVVETMRAAGQMVVASAGNDGSSCNSIRNPISMHDATFSVGAHSQSGAIASFSSRGPVTADGSGRMKPDISAPGVNVFSARLGGGLTANSGTSMASPHVAGAVALLWSAVPELIGNMDLTEQILIKSATPVPANDCGEGDAAVVPNNTYGYGRLNILAAIHLAQTPVSLTVQLADEQTEPLTDQLVTVMDQLTGYVYESTTVFNGLARITPIYPGSYLVSAPGVAATTTVSLTSELHQQVQLTVTNTISP